MNKSLKKIKIIKSDIKTSLEILNYGYDALEKEFEVVRSLYKDNLKELNQRMLKYILNVVSMVTGEDVKDLKSRCRTRDLKNARRIFCYVSRFNTDIDLEIIGEFVNVKRSSVSLASKEIGELYNFDKGIAKIIDEVLQLIK